MVRGVGCCNRICGGLQQQTATATGFDDEPRLLACLLLFDALSHPPPISLDGDRVQCCFLVVAHFSGEYPEPLRRAPSIISALARNSGSLRDDALLGPHPLCETRTISSAGHPPHHCLLLLAASSSARHPHHFPRPPSRHAAIRSRVEASAGETLLQQHTRFVRVCRHAALAKQTLQPGNLHRLTHHTRASTSAAHSLDSALRRAKVQSRVPCTPLPGETLPLHFARVHRNPQPRARPNIHLAHPPFDHVIHGLPSQELFT